MQEGIEMGFGFAGFNSGYPLITGDGEPITGIRKIFSPITSNPYYFQFGLIFKIGIVK